ncbi:hypothetical protein BH09PSE1_BH09PSE1_15250 [soil metagenome]
MTQFPPAARILHQGSGGRTWSVVVGSAVLMLTCASAALAQDAAKVGDAAAGTAAKVHCAYLVSSAGAGDKTTVAGRVVSACQRDAEQSHAVIRWASTADA